MVDTAGPYVIELQLLDDGTKVDGVTVCVRDGKDRVVWVCPVYRERHQTALGLIVAAATMGRHALHDRVR